jgi:hypothetical protein
MGCSPDHPATAHVARGRSGQRVKWSRSSWVATPSASSPPVARIHGALVSAERQCSTHGKQTWLPAKRGWRVASEAQSPPQDGGGFPGERQPA